MKGHDMKTLIIILALAGLISGCARHTDSYQGTGGYDNGSTMGTSTNGTRTTPDSQQEKDQDTIPPEEQTK
jgi:hypothetical protein